MNLWLVTIGEPWPTDGVFPRLYRTGTMAQLFARAGDQVVWFNQVFDHTWKTHRYDHSFTLDVEPRLKLIGLYGPGYSRNVSLKRFWHHQQVANDFRRNIAHLPKPDLIMSSSVPLELAKEVICYAGPRNIPSVIDIRDFWPDAWLDVIPRALRGIGGQVIRPYHRILRQVMSGATALSALSPQALEWGLRYAGRDRSPYDEVLPLAYAAPDLPLAAVTEAEEFWTSVGIPPQPDRLTLCFVGTFTTRVEFETIISAARKLEPDARRKLRIVFCGIGQLDKQLRHDTQGLGCFVFPGWVDAVKLAVLKRRVQIGLLPYPSDPDFMRTLPNKVFDYLTGGLPILTCLRGNAQDLITRRQCGWMYGNNDPDSFNRVIRRLLVEPDEVRQAGDRAKAAATEYDAATLYGKFHSRLVALAERATEAIA